MWMKYKPVKQDFRLKISSQNRKAKTITPITNTSNIYFSNSKIVKAPTAF